MSDDADLAETKLRPSVRPWLIAGVVNLVVATVLLGIPYRRGPERAAEVSPRWAAFAACFYDAEPLDRPGLGLPPGERARYASLVVSGPSDWPARCRPALDAIPPEESMFLFPNVKDAEAQLRATVALMRAELETLAARRAAGDLHVSDRPAQAMQRLRGALAELGLASGAAGLDAGRDALALPDEPGLPVASIVPLRVSEGGAWSIAVRDGAILARTLDTRSVVAVRVSDEGVEQLVTRRPSIVNGLLSAGDRAWAVFATPAATCAQAPDRCARRSTGLAAFVEDRQTLEPMMWLAAHPLASATRSVHVSDLVAHVLGPEGAGARVMRFELVEPTVRALGEVREPPRLSAVTTWDVTATEDSALAWIEGRPPRLVHAREGGAAILTLAPDALEVPFDPPPGRAPQVAACGAWIALASDRAALVRSLDGTNVAPLALRAVPPGPGQLRIVCRRNLVEVWALDERTLSRAVCSQAIGPEGAARFACFAPETVLDGVAAFDVVSHRGATIAVSTDDLDEGVVRVTRMGDDGVRTFVPSPCWSDPPDGLCGEPRIATDGARLAIVTRQEEDLRVVTSRDGVVFGHPAGLEQR